MSPEESKLAYLLRIIDFLERENLKLRKKLKKTKGARR